MENTTIQEAISQSITQNRIVTVETATSDDVESLKLASDDWVKNGPVIEFWGRDDDGDDWRVHVEVQGIFDEHGEERGIVDEHAGEERQ